MFTLLELQKKPDGITFEEILDIKNLLLKRDPSILDIQDVVAKGRVRYEAGLYVLNYHLSYQITLPSSRSMEAVDLPQALDVNELFIKEEDLMTHQELADDELVLILDKDSIDLRESVLDNILLNIPLRVLSNDELQAEELPTGENWSLLTEEQYQSMRSKEKEAQNPFQALSGFLTDEE